LVSESYDNKREVMINLFESPNKELRFEVNKGNILTHNLIIDPEILLLGGTEIDIADLYRTSQKELSTMQSNMDLLTDSLKGMDASITTALLQLEERQKNIELLDKQLEQQRLEVLEGKRETERFKAEVDTHRALIEQQTLQMGQQKVELDKQAENLKEQQVLAIAQLDEINQAKGVLDSLSTEILKQNVFLGTQSEIIKRQRLTITLSFLTVGLGLLLLVILFVSYRGITRRNRLLKEQKQHIENINQKMKKVNQNLYGIIAQLKETQSQLVTSEKMASLGVLTAGLAHEINNPVNFIYTGINSLSKDYNDLIDGVNQILQLTSYNEELNKQVQAIKQSVDFDEILEIIPQTINDIRVGAERTADIVKGLRNFSRIDKDAKQLANVHEGIDAALLLLRNKFKNKITVVKDFSKIPPILCYPGKLNQAFLNVISNAIDAIENEGTITIRTFTDKAKLIISIHDNGKGIPVDIQQRIFDPFFTTKTIGQGVGLGLSITYSIIQEHGGTIAVKSDKNYGAEFTISLPCIAN
jgi:signal transduction histidine kinase